MKFISWFLFIKIALLFSLISLRAGEISFSGDLTDDESSGISSLSVYSHAISGGSEVTVNGVNFEQLDSNQTPSNFSWEVSSIKNQQYI